MVRLTWKDKDGGVFVDGTDCYEVELEGCVTVCVGEVVVRLAEYEDTGLTPHEIGLLQRQKENYRKEIARLLKERSYWEREAKKYCSKLGEIQMLAEGKR